MGERSWPPKRRGAPPVAGRLGAGGPAVAALRPQHHAPTRGEFRLPFPPTWVNVTPASAGHAPVEPLRTPRVRWAVLGVAIAHQRPQLHAPLPALHDPLAPRAGIGVLDPAGS